jgi:hypothetical protein
LRAGSAENFAVAALQPIKCRILRVGAKHSQVLWSIAKRRVSKDEG